MKSTAICLTIVAVGVGLGYMSHQSTQQTRQAVSQAASQADLNARRARLAYQSLSRPVPQFPPMPQTDPWQHYYNQRNLMQQQQMQSELEELTRQTKLRADARNRW